jgi:hypothetical protein
MMTQSLLDQIKADILAKNICPDLAKQANQLVFGSGNPFQGYWPLWLVGLCSSRQ